MAPHILLALIADWYHDYKFTLNFAFLFL